MKGLWNHFLLLLALCDCQRSKAVGVIRSSRVNHESIPFDLGRLKRGVVLRCDCQTQPTTLATSLLAESSPNRKPQMLELDA